MEKLLFSIEMSLSNMAECLTSGEIRVFIESALAALNADEIFPCYALFDVARDIVSEAANGLSGVFTPDVGGFRIYSRSVEYFSHSGAFIDFNKVQNAIIAAFQSGDKITIEYPSSQKEFLWISAYAVVAKFLIDSNRLQDAKSSFDDNAYLFQYYNLRSVVVGDHDKSPLEIASYLTQLLFRIKFVGGTSLTTDDILFASSKFHLFSGKLVKINISSCWYKNFAKLPKINPCGWEKKILPGVYISEGCDEVIYAPAISLRSPTSQANAKNI